MKTTVNDRVWKEAEKALIKDLNTYYPSDDVRLGTKEEDQQYHTDVWWMTATGLTSIDVKNMRFVGGVMGFFFSAKTDPYEWGMSQRGRIREGLGYDIDKEYIVFPYVDEKQHRWWAFVNRATLSNKIKELSDKINNSSTHPEQVIRATHRRLVWEKKTKTDYNTNSKTPNAHISYHIYIAPQDFDKLIEYKLPRSYAVPVQDDSQDTW